jgi:hypothetical protein
MKKAVKTDSVAMYIPSSIKIGSGIQRFMGRDTHTHTHTHDEDRINLF